MCAKSDAYVGYRKRGRIIHPIPNHHYRCRYLPFLSDIINFLLWQTFCIHPCDPRLDANMLCNRF